MKSVKKTRKISVSEKIFTSEDLRRIEAIFDRQRSLAEKSDHRSSIEYEARFEDETKLETDSPELFTDESLISTSRPAEIKINMSFRNYKLNRHIVLSLQHGRSPSWSGNSVRISAEEEPWLSENFLILKEELDKVQPQVFWPRRYGVICTFVLSIGLGELFHLTDLWPHKIIPAPQGLVSFFQVWDAIPTPIRYLLRWSWNA